jgi:hypothetical protein
MKAVRKPYEFASSSEMSFGCESLSTRQSWCLRKRWRRQTAAFFFTTVLVALEKKESI